jgi:hypothetical protein
MADWWCPQIVRGRSALATSRRGAGDAEEYKERFRPEPRRKGGKGITNKEQGRMKEEVREMFNAQLSIINNQYRGGRLPPVKWIIINSSLPAPCL